MTSIGELQSCEKFLMEALARVTERKKYLLSNHLPSYDPSASNMQSHQEGMPNVFGNEEVQWLPQGAPDAGHQIFVRSDPMMFLRDHGIYDPMPQGTGLQVDPHMGGCHVSGQGEAWHHAYTSTELLSALIPSAPFPLGQHPMTTAELPTMVPREQAEGTVSYSHMPGNQNGTCSAT